MLDGHLSFMRKDAGSYVDPTRIVENPIAAAVLAPKKMRRIDIYPLHVSLAHFHANTLRDPARQMGIWPLRSCMHVLGILMRKGGGWMCRGRPSVAPPGV